MNAETAGHVGTPQLKQFHMVYTKEFPRGISDQVISLRVHDGGRERASWSGPQAPSSLSSKRQASSPEQQASSAKPQATSSVILEPRYKKTEEVFLGKGPRAFTMINVFLGWRLWNAI